jgi:osmoprotectant transport system substrate-binding protein
MALLLAASLFAALPFGARAADTRRPVILASKSDTEGAVLGNMIGLLFERAGIPVEYKLSFGPTKAVRSALMNGGIDLYPEYTGNAGYFFDMAADPAWKKADTAYAKAKELDAGNKLVWLTPAPADNSWAIAVRREVAGSNKAPTLEEFARWVSGGGKVKLAASAEFVASPAALQAFQKAYGFTLTPAQIMIVGSGDTALTIRAAAEGKYGVNAAMVYGTDGGIAAAGLKVLRDTKGVQPVYQPAPVVRAEVLELYPELPRVLTAAFEGLTQETLQELNARVQINGEDARAVATDYLRTRRLLR